MATPATTSPAPVGASHRAWCSGSPTCELVASSSGTDAVGAGIGPHREGFGTPGIPVHRLPGVVAEVEARFRRKTVHELNSIPYWFPTSGREPTNANLWFAEQTRTGGSRWCVPARSSGTRKISLLVPDLGSGTHHREPLVRGTDSNQEVLVGAFPSGARERGWEREGLLQFDPERQHHLRGVVHRPQERGQAADGFVRSGQL